MKSFFSILGKSISSIWEFVSFFAKSAFVFMCSWITIAFFIPEKVQKVIEIIKNLF